MRDGDEFTVQTLLLWDIDHTLIENGGVSKENYALAFELLAGHKAVEQPQTGGRTDIEIMVNLLEANGMDSARWAIDEQLAVLAEAGRRNEPRQRKLGRSLPGAAACLEIISSDSTVIQSVLTGNIESNARVKLGAFGLDKWIDFSVGGFGADHRERRRLVPVAQARAKLKYGFDATAGATILVGDTPLDVQAGRAGGARVIGVTTGLSPLAELEHAGADLVIANLEDQDAFMNALRAVQEMGATGPRPSLPASLCLGVIHSCLAK